MIADQITRICIDLLFVSIKCLTCTLRCYQLVYEKIWLVQKSCEDEVENQNSGPNEESGSKSCVPKVPFDEIIEVSVVF